ncbi:hypothetical protein [Dipodfec virus UOA04_Rod_575]|nr:hypothetical protein [Dipodfec virus UOA04_Rod_575]
MSKTFSSQHLFNGANSNVIHARISRDFYQFKDTEIYAPSVDGVRLVAHQSRAELGVVDDFNLRSLIKAGIPPQSVSMGIGSRIDGLSQLDDFVSNNANSENK